MKILAIETSCDETGLAIVEASGGLRSPKFKVLKNLVASQIKIHRPFGGVVPNLAKREHLRNLPILWKRILRKSQIANRSSKKTGDTRYAIRDTHKIDLIAVTVGPGLEPALWTGIGFAKKLREEFKNQKSKIKIIGANHLEGHLYSFLLTKKQQKTIYPKSLGFRNLNLVFPAITLLVSGGHTILLKMESLTKWEGLGETRDDAAGEAFDKVARMLDLPYPGGPEIEKLAREGNPNAIIFPRPMLYDKSYDFSFSGLKTAVLYYLRDKRPRAASLRGKYATSYMEKPDVAASFQRAAIDVLVYKTMRAAKEFNAKSVILCGGVAANKKLRSDMRHATRKICVNFFVPDFKYNLDNAAMIAAAGYMAYLRRRANMRGKKYTLKARGDLTL